MALFKKKTTRYLDADGRQCRKGTPGSTKTHHQSKRWYGRYRNGDRPREVVLLQDEHASRIMLSLFQELGPRLAREVLDRLPPDATSEQVLARGIKARDATVHPFAEHTERPITEHVEAFRRHLADKNDHPKHVRRTCSVINKTLEGCKVRTWADLSASSVQRWLGDQRAAGNLRIKTSNYYLGAMKHFCDWLVQDRRASDNPLAYLKRLNEETEEQRERRVLAEWEFALFIDAARNSQATRCGLTGIDRAAVYLAAAYSGLRASELATLTAASVDLEGDPPALIVKAAYSKRRRTDVQPLRPDVAGELADWLREKNPTGRLWPRSWYQRAAEMLRIDLEAARQTWIENAQTPAQRAEREQSDTLAYEDTSGRVFDFHALRHQYITRLAAAGVYPNTVKQLARHSTIKLTMDRYTHPHVSDLTGALERLPAIPGGGPTGADRGQLPATGTDGQRVQLHLSCTPSASSGRESKSSRVQQTRDDDDECDAAANVEPSRTQGFSGSARSAGRANQSQSAADPKTGSTDSDSVERLSPNSLPRLSLKCDSDDPKEASVALKLHHLNDRLCHSVSTDADLEAVLEAWPKLKPEERSLIKAMVDCIVDD